MLVWPFVELKALADAYDWTVGFRGSDYDAVNGTIFRTRMPLYECPSDTAGTFGGEGCCPQHTGYTRSNYCVTASPDGFIMEPNRPWNKGFDEPKNSTSNPATKKALFNWTIARSVAQTRDGASNTVALSEGTAGPSTGGEIVAGRYDVPAAKGPRAGGTYRVEIAASGTVRLYSPDVGAAAPAVPVREQIIPRRFNIETSLRADVRDDPDGHRQDFLLE